MRSTLRCSWFSLLTLELLSMLINIWLSTLIVKKKRRKQPSTKLPAFIDLFLRKLYDFTGWNLK